MRVEDVIKSEIKAQGITQQKMAEGLGYKDSSAIRMMLSKRSSLQMNRVVAAAEFLGAEIVVRTKDGNEYVITE